MPTYLAQSHFEVSQVLVDHIYHLFPQLTAPNDLRRVKLTCDSHHVWDVGYENNECVAWWCSEQQTVPVNTAVNLSGP